MIVKTKEFDLKAVEGADITPDMLDKVNGYALTTQKEEDVYCRRYLMAHSGIDRDRERFSEDILEDFARTFPGKSFMIVHDTSRLPLGLYFDAYTEEIAPEKFNELTGEEIRLPEGIKTATVLWAWAYLVKADFNAQQIANIDAGVYRHVSIGFSASKRVPVSDANDNVLYEEYLSPGETREGSIVYLGAQPGATSQKSAKPGVQPPESTEAKGILVPGRNNGDRGRSHASNSEGEHKAKGTLVPGRNRGDRSHASNSEDEHKAKGTLVPGRNKGDRSHASNSEGEYKAKGTLVPV